MNKEDDDGNWSKVFYDDFTQTSGLFQQTKKNWYYRYNTDTSVIMKQIKNDAKELDIDLTTDDGIRQALLSYRGQVRYVKTTNDVPYTISPVDSVLYDCVSEFFISKYLYAQTANGFAGKQLIFIKKGAEDEFEEQKRDLDDWIGIDNAGGIYAQWVDEVEDIKKLVNTVKLESTFDDKMLDKTSDHLRDKILGAFDNLPKVLVNAGDGALFGTNPETFENARKFYDSNTTYLRELLNTTLSETLGYDLQLTALTS